MSDTISVKRITIDGEKYLIDGDDNLYDTKTQEQIGTYDRMGGVITFFEEEEDEDDDDDEEEEEYFKTIKVFDKKKQVFNKVNVKRITINGADYLIDKDNVLYEDDTLYNSKYEPRYKKPIGVYDRDITFFRKEEEPPTFVVKIPYPPSIRLNEKEQAYYDKNKKMIDKAVKERIKEQREVEKNPRTRTLPVVIYNKQIMGDVIQTLIAQYNWDTGKSKDRPYTYNEGVVIQTIKKIKEKYANETDENKKATLKRTLVGLMPKIQQAKEVDKAEAVSIPKEMEGMEAAEKETKEYIRLKKRADEKEESRLKAIEDAKVLLTPTEVKSLLTKKNDWVTIVKRPFTAVRFFTKEDKDPYGGKLSGIRDLEYFLPDKIYKVWGDNHLLIDPDTLQELGKFELDAGRSMLSNYPWQLALNTFGKQRLAEYKTKEGKGIDNPELYEKAKEVVYKQYPKHSAYRSGQLVKKYKEMGGTYSGKKPKGGLTSWFKEDWKSIGGDYPTYRPTIRVNKDTPLTASEIDPKQAKKQIALKQEIKGDANLPPFLPLGEKIGEGLASYSNLKIAKKNAVKYLGKNVVLKPSTKKDKKFMVLNPDTNKFIHFGQLGFEDFTKHQDLKRQKNYLNRTANMKGDWKDDKYSANNLAREILWR